MHATCIDLHIIIILCDCRLHNSQETEILEIVLGFSFHIALQNSL